MAIIFGLSNALSIAQTRIHVGFAAFEGMDNDHEEDGEHLRHIDPYLTTGVDFAVGKKKMFHMRFDSRLFLFIRVPFIADRRVVVRHDGIISC